MVRASSVRCAAFAACPVSIIVPKSYLAAFKMYPVVLSIAFDGVLVLSDELIAGMAVVMWISAVVISLSAFAWSGSVVFLGGMYRLKMSRVLVGDR